MQILYKKNEIDIIITPPHFMDHNIESQRY